MEKTYSRINWQNQPSTATALGAGNLNKMDAAINVIDDRVIQVDLAKADKSSVNQMVSNVAMDADTGILTVTLVDGTITTYDLDIEKVVTNFDLNDADQLVLALADGTAKTVDLSRLVTNYTFSDTATIALSNNNKTITATVKQGSITGDHLQANYLADITQQALHASGSAGEAADSALTAKRYAVGGVVEGDATDNAQYYKQQAQLAAEQAQAVTDISIATPQKAGLVKSGGDISVAEDGIVSVVPFGAADVSYTDTHSIGGVDLQTVVDLLADRVLNQLLSLDNIINNQAVTEPGFAADARQLNPTIPGSLASLLMGVDGSIYYKEYHHRDYDTTDPADMLRHFYPSMPSGIVLARITAKSGTSLALIQRYSAIHGSYIMFGYGTLPIFEQLQSGAWKGTKTITIS